MKTCSAQMPSDQINASKWDLRFCFFFLIQHFHRVYVWPVGRVLGCSDWTRARRHCFFGAVASPQPPRRHSAPCLLATGARALLKGPAMIEVIRHERESRSPLDEPYRSSSWRERPHTLITDQRVSEDLLSGEGILGIYGRIDGLNTSMIDGWSLE